LPNAETLGHGGGVSWLHLIAWVVIVVTNLPYIKEVITRV
jgi:hypothetical protein